MSAHSLRKFRLGQKIVGLPQKNEDPDEVERERYRCIGEFLRNRASFAELAGTIKIVVTISVKCMCAGARSRNRTGTPLQAGDFKSPVSTSFTIRAARRDSSTGDAHYAILCLLWPWRCGLDPCGVDACLACNKAARLMPDCSGMCSQVPLRAKAIRTSP